MRARVIEYVARVQKPKTTTGALVGGTFVAAGLLPRGVFSWTTQQPAGVEDRIRPSKQRAPLDVVKIRQYLLDVAAGTLHNFESQNLLQRSDLWPQPERNAIEASDWHLSGLNDEF